ncbi:MAG: M13 family metallopeptidase [Alistipes sp.]|nr:M13 family metallopeptidase [Alistipes sp.]
MNRLTFILATTLIMTSCAGGGKKAADNNTIPAIDTTNLDRSIALNEDFYQWATGGWQAKNPLKAEYSRYGCFDVLRENNEIRINELFQQMTEETAAAGSVEQKIIDLYKMGLDEERLNGEGAEPIRAELEKILAFEDRDELIAYISTLHTDGIAPFFGCYPEADLADSSMKILYVEQGGLGMGNRDYYLDADNASIKESYKGYLAKIFALAGIDEEQIPAMVDNVIAVEDYIASKSWSNVELRDVQRGYNPFTLDELQARYDAIDWRAYFTALGVGEFDHLVVGQPSAMDNVNSILKNLPVETLRSYVAAQYIGDAASYLSEEFAVAQFEFFGKVMSGTQEIRPRWKRAMAVPNSILSEAVGKMYVEKYFPESEKERVLAMVKNLQTALGEHIDALDWMSDATKAKAREKLAAFTVKIGYPDKWKDYSSLTIDPSKSYWENIVEANRWYTADEMAEVGKPVDRSKWFMSPQTVNAYYNPTTNEICFPAAILQPPFYNPTADDAVNYGAIGVVIGHEMTHGFDDQGSQFDKDGNMNEWWTAEDRAAFEKKTAVLVDQFNEVEVLPGIHADGKLSLGENIADQGGLRVAYTAMLNSWNGEKPEPIDGFTPEQRFYISYATLWGQNITDQEIERLTKIDVHSLGRNRVNVTLRNLATFFEAFSIEDGAMFRPAEECVVIW